MEMTNMTNKSKVKGTKRNKR